MTVGIVVFGLVFLAGLAIGTRTRRPLATASVVVGAFCALLVLEVNEPFVAFSSFALIVLVGLVVDSVRETVGLLLGR
jgi:chromate transport protein ChrA